jgi:hypothetical protein
MNGNFTANGTNAINNTGSPTYFQVYSYSGNVTMNGHNGAHMGVVTRTIGQNVVLNGNTPFYGAVVGGQFTANGNNAMHLDLSLLAPSVAVNGFTTTYTGAFARSWSELRPQM